MKLVILINAVLDQILILVRTLLLVTRYLTMTTPHYGAAQRLFIKTTREDIDLNQHNHFQCKDWRNLTPLGGKYVSLNSDKKLDTDSFYVKPIASWVPHLLIPWCVPSCPNCKANTHVDIASSRWVQFPKLLFGVKSHRYLDTKLYPCRACNKEFTGYHKHSIEIDAKVIIGYFNFYLAGKCAVDDELYSFIVDWPDTSSARIARHLQKISAHNYFSDYQLFLHAVRAEKIKSAPTCSVSEFDKCQPTISEALAEQVKNTTGTTVN